MEFEKYRHKCDEARRRKDVHRVLRKVVHAKDEKLVKNCFKIPRLNERFSVILVAPLRRHSFHPGVIVVLVIPRR